MQENMSMITDTEDSFATWEGDVWEDAGLGEKPDTKLLSQALRRKFPVGQDWIMDKIIKFLEKDKLEKYELIFKKRRISKKNSTNIHKLQKEARFAYKIAYLISDLNISKMNITKAIKHMTENSTINDESLAWKIWRHHKDDAIELIKHRIEVKRSKSHQ